MASNDYFRPRGDITTVLDLIDRDPQDNAYFPIDTEASWFHAGVLETHGDEVERNLEENKKQQKGKLNTVYPTALSIQEFPQRGPADWGQKFTFEIGALPAGDLLQFVALQIKLNSWYNDSIITQLSNASITTDLVTHAAEYWTFINSLGTVLIDYAEFVVNDQTIERITGEFIRLHYNLNADSNALFGISADAIGAIPHAALSISSAAVEKTPFHPRRPFPVEAGTYFCVLPFFFLRTKMQEVFPLMSCNEGNVRIDIKLRPFEDMVRRYVGWRTGCAQTPLGSTVTFRSTVDNSAIPVTVQTVVPAFRDVRILTGCSLISGSLREKFLYQPFEQMVKLVQTFHFEEPLKYLVSKPNPLADTVDIQLPLELNHPVASLLWVFRRKAVRINNEWANFTPNLGMESNRNAIYPPWLSYATIRVNGLELMAAEGDWYREHIASVYKGGLTAYHSHAYGFSFALRPADHQPSGTGNMSRTNSVALHMKVRLPIQTIPIEAVRGFDAVEIGGWEVFVYAMYYNWLRFENGLCNRMFSE